MIVLPRTLTQKIVWLKNHGALLTMTWNAAMDAWVIGFTDLSGAYHEHCSPMLGPGLDHIILNLQGPPLPAPTGRRDA